MLNKLTVVPSPVCELTDASLTTLLLKLPSVCSVQSPGSSRVSV